MPIYEYLCVPCNRVYSFFSQVPKPEKIPTCPKCGSTELKKQISNFSLTGVNRKSVAGGRTDNEAGESDNDAMDDPRVEREMTKLMNQAESIDENDPRQLGALMRRMSEITGEGLDGEMEEAVRRLESGEDPEKIEEEMGDVLGDSDDTGMGGMGGAPSYDDGLYDL
ncbi:MAG: FmdB family zinc ribbon protein [Verrucomicrobiota bacterium]